MTKKQKTRLLNLFEEEGIEEEYHEYILSWAESDGFYNMTPEEAWYVVDWKDRADAEADEEEEE